MTIRHSDQVKTTNPDLITAREAAYLLGCTPKSVYEWLHTGKLAGFQLGRMVRIHRAAVEALINAQEVQDAPTYIHTGKPGRPRIRIG